MPIKSPIAGASDTGFHKLLSAQGAISRFRRAVAAMPAVNPNATVNPNDRNTMIMMLARDAPNAARTPNSLIRSDTEQATTLYNPTAAISNASPANSRNSDAAN